jgi:15-cis-phytoene synthase
MKRNNDISEQNGIFKSGSKTFYNTSKFLPKENRQDVTILYAFLRVVDDLVDVIPANAEKYYDFKNAYHMALSGTPSGNQVIDDFIVLCKETSIEAAWVEALFESMEMDLEGFVYTTIEQTLKYIYGAAEVVGLMMVQVLGMPKESYESAKMFGRAAQYCNMFRDIAEDVELGRVYFPAEELAKFGLSGLRYEDVEQHPENFRNFMISQISQYEAWQEIAERGFDYIPKSFLPTVKTASEMYKWTAAVIQKDPFVVYTKKVKPSKLRIFGLALRYKFDL